MDECQISEIFQEQTDKKALKAKHLADEEHAIRLPDELITGTKYCP